MRSGIEVSDDTVYRVLKQLSFAHLSTRPRAYKQDAETMEAFKKRARIGRPPVAVETDCATVDPDIPVSSTALGKIRSAHLRSIQPALTHCRRPAPAK
jgi:hypothetical protein